MLVLSCGFVLYACFSWSVLAISYNLALTLASECKSFHCACLEIAEGISVSYLRNIWLSTWLLITYDFVNYNSEIQNTKAAEEESNRIDEAFKKLDIDENGL